jgi:acyl-lipid omega-6 desaturase (Delta-12 desaturase)
VLCKVLHIAQEAGSDCVVSLWLQYMTETTFNWRMMKNICTELHVYDETINYKAFGSVPGHDLVPGREHLLFELQRKYMP